jgi:hypothetical protein
MATITAAATMPVAAPFNTNPAYSGTFIPTIWSSKLNAKFYTASTFASIANTNWEGEISGMGDKVIINNIPDIAIATYVPGAGLNYQAPTPSTIELVIDQGKYYAFQVNDLLAMQSQPKLLDMFSNDAGMQMKVSVDSECFFATFTGAAAANQGATAGKKSASFNLGTVASPYQLAASTSSAISLITALAAVLDEQDVPESERFLLIDPVTRQALMNSNLQQAYLTGDSQSILRNGKIGMIDRFDVYVTNNLPRGASGGTTWTSGDGSQTAAAGATFGQKSRVIIAGHKSAITFASQFSKTETVRNPSDFGDFVRGVNVYGRKVIKPESLATAIVY